MLSKIFSTAVLIVVAWLAVKMLWTQQTLGAIEMQLHQSNSQLQSQLESNARKTEELVASVTEELPGMSEELLASMSERFEALEAGQKKMVPAPPDPKDKNRIKAQDRIIAKMALTASLKDIQTKLLQAELLSGKQDGAAAAELLLAIKTPVWKLSEKIAPSKDALRGLMAPIDVLAGKWKGGDFSGNTDKIKPVIEKLLAAQEDAPKN